MDGGRGQHLARGVVTNQEEVSVAVSYDNIGKVNVVLCRDL